MEDPEACRHAGHADGGGMVEVYSRTKGGREMIKRTLLIGLVFALAQGVAHAQKNVDSEIDALTARVEKLEGTRAVKKLQMAFGYYVDRGLWGEAADLFA